jgi:hypothetical protein
MQIHNIRETIVADASSSRRAERFDRGVARPGRGPPAFPLVICGMRRVVNKRQPRLIAPASCGNMPNDRCSPATRGDGRNK